MCRRSSKILYDMDLFLMGFSTGVVMHLLKNMSKHSYSVKKSMLNSCLITGLQGGVVSFSVGNAEICSVRGHSFKSLAYLIFGSCIIHFLEKKQ